jgi:UDP-3-O-acyl N-acetylglucosamine deacetylase
LLPAPPDTGVLFVRADLPHHPVISARVELVTGTQRRTTLGGGAESITLVEHLLATLAGLRIDNCLIELTGPEPPGLDGSASGFVDAIFEAGVELQPARRAIWTVTEPVSVEQGGATVSLHPPEPDAGHRLKTTYLLDYGSDSQIPRQTHTMTVTPASFVREVANCRTFVLEREALVLRAKGVGRHLTAHDLLVFGPDGLIDNRLRFANEPARHKVLDLIGDLSLCGFDLVGHAVAYRSGHGLNVALARTLAARAAAAESGPSALPPVLRRPSLAGRKKVFV